MKTKLIYILGPGHCGSTLLSRLLGEVPGFFNAGEAGYNLFAKEREERQSTPCGCGQSAGQCPFWTDIISGISPEVQQYWRRIKWLRFHFLLRSLQRMWRPGAERTDIGSTMAATYAEIRRKAGCQAIVDASKSTIMAALLSRSPDLELYLIHLVRHPYGLVSSFGRRESWIPTMSLPECILKAWWLEYTGFEMVKRRACWHRTILYEDLVKNPKAALDNLTEEIIGARVDLPFQQGRWVTLRVQHDLDGNPNVYRSGRLMIRRADDGLQGWTRSVVWLTTFPLLWRYGYFPHRLVALRGRNVEGPS